MKKILILLVSLLMLSGAIAFCQTQAPPNTYVRFKPISIDNVYAQLRMVIHHSPWSLSFPTLPRGGENYPRLRIKQNQYSGWAQLTPDWGTIVFSFAGAQKIENIEVEIQLANRPDESAVFKTLTIKEVGNIVSIVLPPDFREKPEGILSLRQVSENHLKTARALNLPEDILPKQFGFYAGGAGGFKYLYTDPEIMKNELRTLRTLGMNGVGYPYDADLLKAYEELGFTKFWVSNGGSAEQAEREKAFSPEAFKKIEINALADEPGNSGLYEIEKRPPEEFHSYLESKGLKPADFKVSDWKFIRPITDLDEVEEIGYNWGPDRGEAARRSYYWTYRFSEYLTAMTFKKGTDLLEKVYPAGIKIFVNYTDHPIILGGSAMLPGIDWFEIGLNRATNCGWTEDWLYGGFTSWGNGLYQRLGYLVDILQAAGSRYNLPSGFYNTMDAGDSIRMKALTVIGHGVKTIYFFDYGPTYAATENYWSDSPSQYEGVGKLTRDVAKAEDLIMPGKQIDAQVAIVYGTASEIWNQGKMSSAGHERQLIHIALAGEQYRADVLNEELILMRDLSQYRLIYLVDTNIPSAVLKKLKDFVENGGTLCVLPAAGTRTEYDYASSAITGILGLKQDVTIRDGFDFGSDRISLAQEFGGQTDIPVSLKARKALLSDIKAQVAAKFSDGSPAICINPVKKGKVVYYAFMPGMNYFNRIGAANPKGLVSNFPEDARTLITLPCKIASVERAVELSSRPMEANLLVSEKGAALVIVNVTRTPIDKLNVSVKMSGIKSVTSVEKGNIAFTETNGRINFSLPMGLTDIIMLRK